MIKVCYHYTSLYPVSVVSLQSRSRPDWSRLNVCCVLLSVFDADKAGELLYTAVSLQLHNVIDLVDIREKWKGHEYLSGRGVFDRGHKHELLYMNMNGYIPGRY